MRFVNRLFILIGTIFWSVLLFWYTGSLIYFGLTVLGMIFVAIGGKIHA